MTMFDIFRKMIKPQEVDVKELLGMAGLAERNEKRMEQIKSDMGAQYILHPDNAKHRLDTPRPV